MGSQELYAEPDDILSELDDFFDDCKTNMLKFLNASGSESYEDQTKRVVDCLQDMWDNDCPKLLLSIPKIEKALFGLEMRDDMSNRYREHFVHMFNVYLLGCRILSLILKNFGTMEQEDVILRYFKVEPETKAFPFQEPYSARERLFFLWKIISTYHDIGIPFQHLSEINRGLNAYFRYFGYKLPDSYLEREEAVSVKLGRYLELMSSLFPSGISPSNGIYVNREVNPYIMGVLLRQYEEMNHGVMSAIGLFHSFESLFLDEHQEIDAYNLPLEQHTSLVRQVLEHDIARACFCHAMHSISEKRYPRLFPVSFDKYPLLFLLVLCDELQEFFRLEGITLGGIQCLRKFPSIDVHCDSGGRINLNITVCYMHIDIFEMDLVLESVKSWALSKKLPIPRNYKEVLVNTWTRITDILRGKLCLGTSEAMGIGVQVYLQEADRVLLLESWNSDGM